MIEVEQRTFISKEDYEMLINKFKEEIITTKQLTYYFTGPQDFRIMFTPTETKLWLKEGQIHDDARHEYEVFVEKTQNESLLKMLNVLGFITEIKWFRTRNAVEYSGIKLAIDYTEGYGYILEAELLVPDEEAIEEAQQSIMNIFKDFNIEISPKSAFKEKYEDYKINWSNYTKDIDEQQFLS